MLRSAKSSRCSSRFVFGERGGGGKCGQNDQEVLRHDKKIACDCEHPSASDLVGNIYLGESKYHIHKEGIYLAIGYAHYFEKG